MFCSIFLPFHFVRSKSIDTFWWLLASGCDHQQDIIATGQLTQGRAVGVIQKEN